MIHPSLVHMLKAAQSLHQSVPALAAFTPWPDGLAASGNAAPNPLPAADLVAQFPLPGVAQTQDLVDRIRQAAPVAHWKRTYTEEEVGADFRARYGYFELVGPSGHFHSEELRAYVGYWGAGLHYDWHHHEAEEIYLVLAGSAEFHAENAASVCITPGGHRQHYSNQPHAMTTHDQPVLALVLWRGPGLSGLPKMGHSA